MASSARMTAGKPVIGQGTEQFLDHRLQLVPFGCRQRGEHLIEDLKPLAGCGHRGPVAGRGENQGP
jgi:hypothetical protein